MVEYLYCQDMVESLYASHFQHFNALACPPGTVGRAWDSALQQPCQKTGITRGGFNHNVAGFLTIMAVESEKTELSWHFCLPQSRYGLTATLCLSSELTATLWVKPSPSVAADSKERR